MQGDDRRDSEAYLAARRLLTARDRPPRPLILPLLFTNSELESFACDHLAIINEFDFDA